VQVDMTQACLENLDADRIYIYIYILSSFQNYIIDIYCEIVYLFCGVFIAIIL